MLCDDCESENGYLAEAGEVVTLNIVPEDGYSLNCYGVFKKSGGSVPVTDNQFIMPADEVAIMATFTTAEPTYPVNVTGGTSDKSEAIAGETVNITANVAPLGKEFDKWTTANAITFAEENDAITSFVMIAQPVTVTATYKDAEKRTVTIIVKEDDEITPVEGATVTVTQTGKRNVYTEQTDIEGKALFSLPDGNYSYTVTKDGYIIKTGDFEVDGEDKVVETNISIRSLSQAAEFAIYPVPASDIVKVVRAGAGKARIEIYSSNGDLLQSHETADAETEINVSSLPAGVYMIRVIDAQKASTQRLMIE
jgi:hypothetical protein